MELKDCLDSTGAAWLLVHSYSTSSTSPTSSMISSNLVRPIVAAINVSHLCAAVVIDCLVLPDLKPWHSLMPSDSPTVTHPDGVKKLTTLANILMAVNLFFE